MKLKDKATISLAYQPERLHIFISRPNRPIPGHKLTTNGFRSISPKSLRRLLKVLQADNWKAEPSIVVDNAGHPLWMEVHWMYLTGE